jgi:hypothetical protein
VTPTFDEAGRVIGYQNTPQGQSPDMQTAEGADAATARALGLNPYFTADGRVDWNATIGSGDFLGHNYLGTQRGLFDQAEDAQINQAVGAQQAAYDSLLSPGGYTPQALQAMQGQLTTAQALQDPALYRMGVTRDQNGNLIIDWNSPEQGARTLQGQFITRANQALQGNLPVDPGLQRQLDEQERQLRSQLQASLGPDYATSSPGSAALADFNKRKAEVLYDQQQQAMNSSVSNFLNLQGGNLSTLQALNGVTAPALTAANALNTANLNRNTSLSQTAQMLQPILSTKAQGDTAYQSGINSSTFGTLAALAQAANAYPTISQAALANQGQRLNNLYGGIIGGYKDPGYQSLAALTGQLGTNNTALPWAGADWQGKVTNDATNQNNIFWRSLAQSAGSSLGKGAGGGFV